VPAGMSVPLSFTAVLKETFVAVFAPVRQMWS
jgi:hypothetical protein